MANLRFNDLAGPIPPELGRLSRLVSLMLGDNDLSGPIPAELGNLASLEFLGLESNDLSGSIPAQLASLAALETLYLQFNGLSGTIPAELGKLSKLSYLDLHSNRLAGPIPPELGNAASLSHLNLSANRLGGAIPPELGKLGWLWWLYLHENGLSGPIPAELARLDLQVLRLNNNRLTGQIPVEFQGLVRLRHLDLSHNELSGPVPPELDQLRWLDVLSLQFNRLDGMPDLTGHFSLDRVDVRHNRMGFEDLEPNAVLVTTIDAFLYAPQDSIDTRLRRSPTELVLTVSTGGTGSEYQWYRDGQAIADEIEAELRVDPGAPRADYHATVTHPGFPALTLVSRPLASDTPESIEEASGEAIAFGLHPNYPNPFAGAGHILFDVARPVRVRLILYDMLGRRVRTLVDAPMLPGRYRVSLDEAQLAPGQYHYHMQAGSFSGVRTMTILR